MDAPQGKRRTRRPRKSRRQTPTAGEDEAIVTKEAGLSVSVPVSVPVPVPVSSLKKKAVSVSVPAPVPAPVAVPRQKIILSPPKKKAPKVLLVPKVKVNPVVKHAKKTFRAKRVRLTIDNTAKTQKRRQSITTTVDGMTEDQIRGAAVAARLSRRETVAKAPIGLLRQMIMDYQTMKGMLL